MFFFHLQALVCSFRIREMYSTVADATLVQRHLPNLFLVCPR